MAPVLVDTNIIIEAVRARCWNALAGRYQIETVETCFDEVRAGDPLRPGYVTVDAAQLTKLSARHAVTDLERAHLALTLPTSDALDSGERDLFAHALGRTGDWTLCCADRAAVNAALALGWHERIVSLGKLVAAAGSRPDLKDHFTEKWLAEVRTLFALAGGPR
jgi:hypothetical protein